MRFLVRRAFIETLRWVTNGHDGDSQDDPTNGPADELDILEHRL